MLRFRREDLFSLCGEINVRMSQMNKDAEFSRYLFDHPEFEEKLSIDTGVIRLPEYDKELKEFNLQLGKGIEAEGGKVVYISIKGIRPKALSRIEKIEFQVNV